MYEHNIPFIKIDIGWDITPCSQFEINLRLEEHIASIFMVEEEAKLETSMKQVANRVSFMLASYSVHSSILKMLAKYSSETSVDFQMDYTPLYPRRQNSS
jgi:hypothetical protein